MNILLKYMTNLPLGVLILMSALAAAPLQTLAETVGPGDGKTSTLPKSWPRSFQETGFVGEANGRNRSVTIGGTRYYYGINTKVHTENSNFASTSNIKSGSELGFTYVEDAKKRRFLNEVWILPAGSLTNS